MSQIDDLDNLITQAQKGDSQAFTQIYDIFVDRIFRYLKIKVTDPITAEDLLQETFIKSWKSLDQFEVPGNFQAWLYRIATNCVNDHFRKVYRRPQTVELDEKIDLASNESISEEIAGKIETEQITKAFKLLPGKYGQVLELRFTQDMSIEETAKILNCSSLSVRVSQHRALKKLREIIEKEKYDFGYSRIQ